MGVLLMDGPGNHNAHTCSLLQVEFHSSVAGVFCGELELSFLII